MDVKRSYMRSFKALPLTLCMPKKNSVFGPKKGHFGQSGPQNGLPSSQTPPTGKPRYPELPQDMGDLWSHWVSSVRAKKGEFQRCSVKKCRISGRKCSFLAQNPFFCQKRPTFLLPSWPDNKKTTFLCWPRCTAGLGAAAGARFWPENLHFFTLRLYNPHFFGSDGPDSMGS